LVRFIADGIDSLVRQRTVRAFAAARGTDDVDAARASASTSTSASKANDEERQS
jgi:hypothetical protein